MRFLHRTQLNTLEVASLLLYALVSGVTFWQVASGNIVPGQLASYAVATHVGLYVLCYQALRKRAYCLSWCLFGGLHLVIYSLALANSSLPDGSPTGQGLRGTLMLLAVFQVLRYVSQQLQQLDLVCPALRSTRDLFDERRITALDWLLLLLYLAAVLVVNVA